MNVTFEKVDNTSGKLSVAVEENDYQAKVTDELKRIGRNHVIPGFRKGHVPTGELKRRFGRDVTSDVINHIVYEAVVKYLQDNKLGVLGEPIPVEIVNLDTANKKDFTFEYEIGLAPEINVELTKDITIPYYKIEITDKMVEDQDKTLRERFGSQQPVEVYEDRAIVKGALMELNEDGSIKDGEGAIQNINCMVGPWHFSSAEETAKFEGKKVGDKVVFNPYNSCAGNIAELASMLGIDRDKAADVKGNFELAISEIVGLKAAEHNEEFFKNTFGAECTDEEKYQESLRKYIESQLMPNSSYLFQRDARNILMEKFGNFELPATFLKKWLIRKNEELNDTNIDEEYAKSENGIKWQLLKERIAEQTGMKIEEQDLLNYATHIAARQFAQYGMTNIDEETLKSYAQNLLNDKKFRPQIIEQVGDAKLFETIQQSVNVPEETVSMERFQELAKAE